MKIRSGADLIVEERKRQISKEGWTAQHDDGHEFAELADAAVCYIRQAQQRWWLSPKNYQADSLPFHWPWDRKDWKPKTPILDLVKAGALVAAEIDRLQRIKPPNKP